MQDFLRGWRQDAMQKHQYESAIYIGDKLLALTNEPNDAFFLAQVYFATGNYSRALGFLEKNQLVEHSPACRYLAADCQVRQGKYEEALTILGDHNPSHLIISPSKQRRKLYHATESSSSLGASKSSAKSDRAENGEDRARERTTDIKYEAAMCFLRGLCFAKQNAFDRAKLCYQDAVRIDLLCFEAFDQLMRNKLMSPDEEWAFLESLEFDSPSNMSVDADADTHQETAQFVRMLYTTRLSKYKNAAEFSHATETLSTHYNLAANADLLLAQAELLFTQCRFKESLAITNNILEDDPYNFACLPLHLASLNELGQKNALFLLSHRLADSHPEEPGSWLAVGTYYLSISQIAEARRFFSKASMMDPHFGPAWIGFAHTFAAEGEHDQAVSAYSTAARLFQGTHLPQLFLGMQNLLLGNMNLAHGYLGAAHELCKTDPLLLNEMGVVFYHLDHLDNAITLFTRALEVADSIDSNATAWTATRANLGHAYRRQGRFIAALEQFNEVLRKGQDADNSTGGAGSGIMGTGGIPLSSNGRDYMHSNANSNGANSNSHMVSIFSSKGLVLLELGRTWEAICAFHEALGLQPQDPVATDLLARALEENASANMDAIDRQQIPDKKSKDTRTNLPSYMDGSSSVPDLRIQDVDAVAFKALLDKARHNTRPKATPAHGKGQALATPDDPERRSDIMNQHRGIFSDGPHDIHRPLRGTLFSSFTNAINSNDTTLQTPDLDRTSSSATLTEATTPNISAQGSRPNPPAPTRVSNRTRTQAPISQQPARRDGARRIRVDARGSIGTMTEADEGEEEDDNDPYNEDSMLRTRPAQTTNFRNRSAHVSYANTPTTNDIDEDEDMVTDTFELR